MCDYLVGPSPFRPVDLNPFIGPFTLEEKDSIIKDIREYCPPARSTFCLFRGKDESGVSGTGLVLEGCVFKDGTCVVRWCTPDADSSTVVYGIEDGKRGFQRFLDIHVHSHPLNDCRIVFDDGKVWKQEGTPEEKEQAAFDRVKKAMDTWYELKEQDNG